MPQAMPTALVAGAVELDCTPKSFRKRPCAVISSCRARCGHYQWGEDSRSKPGDQLAALDTASIGILLGALLVLAGIMSSLVALRFGAPLLLVFLIVGMLAGEG